MRHSVPQQVIDFINKMVESENEEVVNKIVEILDGVDAYDNMTKAQITKVESIMKK